jgi:PAS domain S-box-containing protein
MAKSRSRAYQAALNPERGCVIPTSTDTELVATRNALRERGGAFRILADAMPQMVWSTLPDGFHDYYNSQWYDFTGVPAGSTDGEAWNGMFHPDDQESAWARWQHSLATGEPYEIEYRLRHHSGEYRWTIGRALPIRDESGTIIRWMGTCTDIHDAKRQAEMNEVLSRELSHRIKNIFAVVAGLIGLSAREEPAQKSFARRLQERIGALGRAHEFVRPHSEQSSPDDLPGSLHGVLREILSPYPALEEGRIRVRGDDTPIDDQAATPVAMLFHELATNSAKYGALLAPNGHLDIEITTKSGYCRLNWRESGGPPIVAAPERVGFGTRLADLSIIRQLGGQIEREWKAEGLEVEIWVALSRLARGSTSPPKEGSQPNS